MSGEADNTVLTNDDKTILKESALTALVLRCKGNLSVNLAELEDTDNYFLVCTLEGDAVRFESRMKQ